MTLPIDAERAERVRSKADDWAHKLVDLSPRNTALFFKSTKAASLDLGGTEPTALGDLLDGKPVRLTALFVDPETERSAAQSVRSIAARIAAFEEEQGVDVGKVAHGIVTMPSPATRGSRSLPPLRAPLLLRTVHISARTLGERDYVLSLDSDVEINPVLLHALDKLYGLDIDPAVDINSAAEAILQDTNDRNQHPVRIHQLLAEVAERQRAELTLEPSIVIGLFHYEKLPMVDDLQVATELLAEHDVVAALAGHQPTAELLAADAPSVSPEELEHLEPRSEFLVQNADSSQHRAICAALAGHHVLVEGPPGTGKSQTIANIIAGAAAIGKRVLFVAEKRAAIEAVTDRLAQVDLDDLVLDLHRQRMNKRQVAAQLQASLETTTRQLPVDATDLHRRLGSGRTAVRAYPDELHAVREPWGLSAFDVQAELLALPAPQSNQRLRGTQLRALDRETVARLKQDLQEFVEKGGQRILRQETPWFRASVRDEHDIARVIAELDDLTGHTLQQGQQQIRNLVSQAGLEPPRDLSSWQHVLQLFDGVHRSVQAFGPTAFGEQLDEWWCATGPRAVRSTFPTRLGFFRRRALLKQVRAASTAGTTQKAVLHRQLTEVRALRDYWRGAGGQQVRPADAAALQQAAQLISGLRTRLAAVAMCAQLPEVEHQPTELVDQALHELHADREILWRMPRLTALIDDFGHASVLGIVQEAAQRNLSGRDTWLLFRRIWLESLLDQIKLDSPVLREFVADRQLRLVEEFQAADVEHLQAAALRVRREVAVAARKARDNHPDQTQRLKREAAKKSRHWPIRRLVDQAPHVLLALRPCWAMSPLVVSRILPPTRLFDLVVFDEASQIEPHDAIAAIARGRSIVVAGDDNQLPPTNFFSRLLDGSDEADEDDGAGLQDYESILKALRPLLPEPTRLRWHYRSRDERLIAFANRFVYDDDLVTFPGAFVETPVILDIVDGVASPGQDGSAPAEIEQVVRRVIEHVEQRPHDSLGVITMGQKHMDRVDKAIRDAARERPDMLEFIDPEKSAGQRFFVKNLERVQGDERDAIILSVGVAKRANGTVARNGFGPLNREDGRRRLNVAVTRAKRRMTVISSFGPHDLKPDDRPTGTELLRRYLEFAQNDCDIDRVGSRQPVPLNGFEQDVVAALNERGIAVQPQWGFSDYRIDFALPHRDQPGRMVLAVECDGDRYHHSYHTRDRDRLRQLHLENLGWRFHRVWASAWFADRAGETDRIVSAWEKAMIDADREPEPAEVLRPAHVIQTPTAARGARPAVPAGLKYNEYTEAQLVDLCRWLLTDGLLLDCDERVDQALRELGFQRRGVRIVQRLTRAAEIAQCQADREEQR